MRDEDARGMSGGAKPIRVGLFEIHEGNALTEVSADVDGFRLRFSVPVEYDVSRSGDPFLACALLPAMATGRHLIVDSALPVSAILLENLRTLQEIFHSWNPLLRVVPIDATTVGSLPLRRGAMSFFSGGVDSTYTLLKHEGTIDRAVYIRGFDFDAGNDGLRALTRRNEGLACAFGAELLCVETNHYRFGYSYGLSRNLSHGSLLAAVALVLGFETVYIPASCSYAQQVPFGSHPLTDPLWSNGAVKIIHDGCEADRTTKLKSICVHEKVRDSLWVCLETPAANCGACEKCLRTMVALRTLGVSAPAFPPLDSLGPVKRGLAHSDADRVFLAENYRHARDNKQKDPALWKALRTATRRSELVRIAESLDETFLGGSLARAYELRKYPDGRGRFINATPPKG